MSTKAPSIFITAGPTREAIDDVRFLSNRSTGRMGIEIALAAAKLGWRVTLVLGPGGLSGPTGTAAARIETVNVESAADMFAAVQARFVEADVFVASAAVADYTPATRVPGKLKKKPGPLSLELIRTVDILAWAGEHRSAKQVLVGFALEADRDPQSALPKLHAKRCDMIVHNSTDNFGESEGRVTILTAEKTLWQGSAAKPAVAAEVVRLAADVLAGRSL